MMVFKKNSTICRTEKKSLKNSVIQLFKQVSPKKSEKLWSWEREWITTGERMCIRILTTDII